MLNIQGIMKQAQQMQRKMQETQAKLAQEEKEGVSGGNLVKVVLNGKSEMKKICHAKAWQCWRRLAKTENTAALFWKCRLKYTWRS